MTGLKLTYSRFKNSILFKNIFSLSISQIGNYLIPLLVIPYLTHLLGPAKFGLVSFAQVFITYFTLIINYGFDYTITRKIVANKDNPEHLSSIFWNVIYAKIFLFLASTLILIFLLQIPRFNNMSWLLLITHIINVGFIFYPSWFFQGMQDLKIVAILSFLIKLLYALLIFIFIKNENDYLLNNLFLSISQVVISGVSLFIAIRRYHVKVAPIDKLEIASIISEGRLFFFSTAIINIYTYTNTFLLGLLATESETAYFNVVFRIIFSIQGLLLLPFNVAFFPYISDSFNKNNYVESNKKLLRACALMLLITFICGVILFLSAPYIVPFLFGKDFQRSVDLLRFLAFIPMFMGIVNVFGYNGLIPLHQDKKFLLITLAGGCISILLNILLIPDFGSYAVAGVWIGIELFIGLLCFLFYKRALKIRIYSKLI